MHAVIAGASPDNTPSGYYWTFLFPMVLFIVIALTLWALFGRPHQRVPAQRIPFGLSGRRPVADTPGPVGTAAAASTSETAGASGAYLTASAEPERSAGADETNGEQPPADGAGAGAGE
ncbi:MAG: hypothetical protein ACRDOK_16535 [Streptosporangiaceae bacterium]